MFGDSFKSDKWNIESGKKRRLHVDEESKSYGWKKKDF